MSVPALAVVMAVHDGERYLADALASVLAQSFDDFELVVVDDGSSDRSAVIVRATSDRRVSVLSQPRAGLTVSLNRAVAASRAPLLARMDADDVALPERFARQFAFLAAHPDVGLLGTACREIDAAGVSLRDIVPPEDDAALRRALVRANPFVHASVMMRRDAFVRAGGYDGSLAVAQDYDLWFRMSRLTRMANLPEPLLLRRMHEGQVSIARERERLHAEVRIKARALVRGGYGPWAALHLVKPLAGLAMTAGMRRTLRRARRLAR